MEMKKHISVLATGNPASGSGVAPIVMSNNPQFNVEFETHGGLDNNAFYFTVKIENNYTIYKLIKNNVRSNGAFRGGYLAIAFSIPRGYELESSNPYQVLLKLWDKFKESCMTLKDKQLGVYEYNNSTVDKTVLDETAQSFTLRQTKRPYRPMNSKGKVALVIQPNNKIEELLSDIQYPEFSDFCEILIAEHAGDVSNYALLNNLKIPRPVSFALFVDGKFKKNITDREQKITITTNLNSLFYNNVAVEFSITEIENGNNVQIKSISYTNGEADNSVVVKNDINGIDIDEANEKIEVSTSGWAAPKTYKYHVEILPAEARKFFTDNKNALSITKGERRIIFDKDLNFELTGEEIGLVNKGEIRVNISENKKYRLSSNTRPIFEANKLKITVERVPTEQNPAITHGNDLNKKKSIRDIRNNPFKEVKLYVVGKIAMDIAKKNESIIVECKDFNGKLVLSSRISLSKSANGDNALEGTIYIPEELATRCQSISIIAGYNEYTSQINSSNNEWQIDDSKKKGLAIKKLMFPITAIMVASALVIGSIFGMFIGSKVIGKWNNETTTDSLASMDKSGSDDTDSPTDINKEDVESFIEQANDNLDKKDVTFEEIHSLYNESLNFSSAMTSEEGIKMGKKIREYENLAIAIETGDIDNAKKIAGSKYINKQHADKVRILREPSDCNGITSFEQIEDTGIEPRNIEQNNVSKNNSTKVKCENCGQLIEQSKLNRHKLSHHAYKCPICGKKFISQEELDKHVLKSHDR